MKAAVLYDKCEITIEEVDKVRIKRRDQVLIKISAAGLFGADLNIYAGNIQFPYPMVPGYCFSGVVEEVGAEVTEFQIWERVCGLNFGSFGAFAEYIVASQDRIFKIPDNVSFEAGAFIEPAALAFKSLKLTKPVRGENTLILGQGSLGLVHTQIFKESGTRVFVSDPIPSRLKLSRRFGADYTFNPKKCDVLKEISNITERGIDIVVEATGSSKIVGLLSKLVKEGVRMVLFSTWNPAIRQFKTSEKGIEIYKIFGTNREDCTAALKMISDGKVNLKPLINERVSLKRIEVAYRMVLNPSQGKYTPKAIGIIIDPWE